MPSPHRHNDGVVPAYDRGFLDVTSLGAKGDYQADDTDAFQRALNESRRIYVPYTGSTYKTGQLTVRPGTVIEGEAWSGDHTTTPISKIESQVVGLTNTPNAFTIPAGSFAAGDGVVFENLWIKGKAAQSTDWTGSAFPSRGIYAQTQHGSLTLQRVKVSGFNYNVVLTHPYRVLLDFCILDGAVDGNLYVTGPGSELRIHNSHLRVVNESGTAAAAATLFNMRIEGSAGARVADLTVRDTLFDELARQPGGPVPSTVYVEAGESVLFDGVRMYVPISTNGAGYGLRLGTGVSRMAVRSTRIEPYVADGTHVPLNTILIPAGASGVSLQDVTTVANGGGDISDLATDTEWRNVNGISKYRRYATGSRPGAAAAGAGAYVVDSTLNKLIISDGTNWRDTAGTIV